jgi:tetratricopeptide (TPR) repeat protein
VPIDRAATLRNAEKFLKQGKLDSAIAEYLRVVEDQPRDWNTANLLGDLYVRAGQADKAVEQFTRIADSFGREGFLPKASALYKKVLKLKPDHEHALIQAAEIAAAQGVFVDARAYLKSVAEERRRRGDQRGAAEIQLRLGSLDPADYGARIAAGLARAGLGEPDAAVKELKAIALELSENSRPAEAAEALAAAASLVPNDDDIRAGLIEAYIASLDVARARAIASAAADYRAIAAALTAAGQERQAIDVLREAVARYPADADLKTEVAKALMAQGDVAGAAEYFDGPASEDPVLALRIAEGHLASGHIESGLALLHKILQDDPLQRDAVAMLGWTIASRVPDATFEIIDLAAAIAVEQGDFNWAARALEEFVRQVPGHVPALMRLVEVCVDGGLERATPIAQAQLVDGYLDAGSAVEALAIAEDLVLRDPAKMANIDRLRRALILCGEPDPEAVIADRLNPLPSVDERGLAAEEPESPPAEDRTPDADLHVREEGAIEPAAAAPASELFELEVSPPAIDIESILRELEPPAAPARTGARSVEIDLSIVLDTIKPGTAPQPAPAPAPPPAETSTGADIDAVFGQLREEASRRRQPRETAEQDYARGASLYNAGETEAAIDALQTAAQSPGVRFQAASLVSRIYRSRGKAAQAIEWLERAADASAPSAEQAHALLYELAELLESEGETARALAVCLELQAEAGEYRDISERADRLAKAQARG